MTGAKAVYWDSCVFFALLKEETDKAEYPVVKDAALLFDAGQIQLVTSSIMMTEVLDSTFMNDAERLRFRDMTTRDNFVFVPADYDTCSMAGEIRDFYRKNPVVVKGKKMIPSTPDAIHAASAIRAGQIANAPIKLWTFDVLDKPEKNEMALISLSGNVANKYPLEVIRPSLI